MGTLSKTIAELRQFLPPVPTAEEEGRGRPDISVWRIRQVDFGYLYIFKHRNRFKVGKTTNPLKRIRDARTWIPDVQVLGVKPFWGVSHHERLLHCGLAQFWLGGEWFEFPDESYDTLFEEFAEFYDEDPDWNTIDFIYWFNGTGLGELVQEQNHRKVSLRTWLRTANS